MASLIPENWGCINGQDDFDKFKVSEINCALLMSLLDEPQVDQECDDERLTSVIRSLEAEINPNMIINGHINSVVELEWDGILEGCEFSDWGQVDSQDCLTTDLNWMDIDDITSMYMDPCEGEMDGMIEFGGVGDYSQICYGIPLEEHAYGSLWQVTNAPVM